MKRERQPLESPLDLPGRVHIEREPDDLFDALSEAMLKSAEEAIESRGVFHLALSGGSSPEPFYKQLVTDPQWRDFPWRSTHVWIVDERRVPEDDEQANIRMIRESLTEHVPMRQRQIHPMPVMEADPATPYERDLKREVGVEGDDPPKLDFLVLGMGGDCHTASLFPGSDAVHVTDRWVTVNAGPAVTPPDRVTMTFPLINAGRSVAVLLTGAKKFDALKRVEQQVESAGPDPVTMPITGVQPAAGPLLWYLDAAAVGLTVA